MLHCFSFGLELFKASWFWWRTDAGNTIQDLIHSSNTGVKTAEKKQCKHFEKQQIVFYCDWKTSVIRNLRSVSKQPKRKTMMKCVWYSGRAERGLDEAIQQYTYTIWCKKRRDNDIDSCFLSLPANFSLAFGFIHTKYFFCCCCSNSDFAAIAVSGCSTAWARRYILPRICFANSQKWNIG